MAIMKREENVAWAPRPNVVEVFTAESMPAPELCTSAYVLAFDEEGRLLMADLDRGIDIPGGHLDAGENPLAGMRRETREETGATIGHAELLCVQKVTLLCARPEGYAYPYPDSYQLIYFSREITMGTFTVDEDSKGPVMIGPEKAPEVPWLQKNAEIYALATARFKAAAPSSSNKKPYRPDSR